jgi:hypothetical protein
MIHGWPSKGSCLLNKMATRAMKKENPLNHIPSSTIGLIRMMNSTGIIIRWSLIRIAYFDLRKMATRAKK